VRRFLETSAEPRERRYAHWLMHFNHDMKLALCRPEFVQATGGDSADYLVEQYRRSEAPDFTGKTLDVDVQTYLPNDLLVKVDVASMAHSLEARSPLLDHKVMELAATFPSGFKLRGFEKKWILKDVARDLLPDEVLSRPKRGFGVPIEHWFRGSLRDLLHDVLLSTAAVQRGYFDPAFVRRLVDDHLTTRQNRHFLLWNLLMLELWHRMFLDTRPVGIPADERPVVIGRS
jgi:asparagine synthase (glutamine-hydrolysing)